MPMSSFSVRYDLAGSISQQLLLSIRLEPIRSLHCGAKRGVGRRRLSPRTIRSLPISTIYFAKSILMSNDQSKGDDPVFPYTQLWASKDGETHIQECLMNGFEYKKYASAEQFVKAGGTPIKAVFTELSRGFEQDLHCCPQVQLVITLKGSWYVKTTDGTKKVFSPGEVLFQDNTKDCPADKEPMHYSGPFFSRLPNIRTVFEACVRAA
eukprot:jgi/Botrbrau1/8097/Bobra.0230s0022.2